MRSIPGEASDTPPRRSVRAMSYSPSDWNRQQPLDALDAYQSMSAGPSPSTDTHPYTESESETYETPSPAPDSPMVISPARSTTDEDRPTRWAPRSARMLTFDPSSNTLPIPHTNTFSYFHNQVYFNSDTDPVEPVKPASRPVSPAAATTAATTATVPTSAALPTSSGAAATLTSTTSTSTQTVAPHGHSCTEEDSDSETELLRQFESRRRGRRRDDHVAAAVAAAVASATSMELPTGSEDQVVDTPPNTFVDSTSTATVTAATTTATTAAAVTAPTIASSTGTTTTSPSTTTDSTTTDSTTGNGRSVPTPHVRYIMRRMPNGEMQFVRRGAVSPSTASRDGATTTITYLDDSTDTDVEESIYNYERILEETSPHQSNGTTVFSPQHVRYTATQTSPQHYQQHYHYHHHHHHHQHHHGTVDELFEYSSRHHTLRHHRFGSSLYEDEPPYGMYADSDLDEQMLQLSLDGLSPIQQYLTDTEDDVEEEEEEEEEEEQSVQLPQIAVEGEEEDIEDEDEEEDHDDDDEEQEQDEQQDELNFEFDWHAADFFNPYDGSEYSFEYQPVVSIDRHTTTDDVEDEDGLSRLYEQYLEQQLLSTTDYSSSNAVLHELNASLSSYVGGETQLYAPSSALADDDEGEEDEEDDELEQVAEQEEEEVEEGEEVEDEDELDLNDRQDAFDELCDTDDDEIVEHEVERVLSGMTRDQYYHAVTESSSSRTDGLGYFGWWVYCSLRESGLIDFEREGGFIRPLIHYYIRYCCERSDLVTEQRRLRRLLGYLPSLLEIHEILVAHCDDANLSEREWALIKTILDIHQRYLLRNDGPSFRLCREQLFPVIILYYSTIPLNMLGTAVGQLWFMTRNLIHTGSEDTDWITLFSVENASSSVSTLSTLRDRYLHHYTTRLRDFKNQFDGSSESLYLR